MIAQSLAVRHPTQVRRPVLCATFPGTGTVPPSLAAIRAILSGVPQEVEADLFPADKSMAYEALAAGISSYPAAPPAAAAPKRALRVLLLPLRYRQLAHDLRHTGSTLTADARVSLRVLWNGWATAAFALLPRSGAVVGTYVPCLVAVALVALAHVRRRRDPAGRRFRCRPGQADKPGPRRPAAACCQILLAAR